MESCGESLKCGNERRALVIGARGDRPVICPIRTSEQKVGLWRSLVIDDWKQAGLKRQRCVSVDFPKILTTSWTGWKRVIRSRLNQMRW